MMTIEERRRDLFHEAIGRALIEEGYQPASIPSVIARSSNGEYQTIRIAGAWLGFNAALDAVAIDLPAVFGDTHHEISGAIDYRCAVRAAIESTGLGLKVKA